MTSATGPARDKRCTFCHGPIVAPRRRTWCSQACVDAYLEATDRAHWRRKVWERDQGICALCGIKTDYTTDGHRGRPDTLYELDHIVPITDGGARGLENLRVLCRACHLAVTAEWHRERTLTRHQGASEPIRPGWQLKLIQGDTMT